MLKTDFTIAALIAKYITGDIEPHEKAALDNWKNESEHNKILFEKVMHPDALQRWQQKAQHYDTSVGWERYLHKQHKMRAQKRRGFLLRTTRYAAIFLLLLSAGYLFYIFHKSDTTTHEPRLTVSELIVPGGTKATLTLADGSTIALAELDDYKLEETIAANEKNPEVDATIVPTVYHKIETPRGGEYAFTLSDGTFVRLNAMSAIHFPVVFGDHPRLVELEGEAFFDVTNTGQPFMVKTKDFLIEVMGTSFNISSYSDEVFSSVTLVSGSVKVETPHSGDALVITPSQQALFNRSTEEVSVHFVDISSHIAWSNGVFYFKDWTLESIMHYLSRWYDIDEVIYENERLKSMIFGCKLSKYDYIDAFLSAFEHTGKVRFTIQDRTIRAKTNDN